MVEDRGPDGGGEGLARGSRSGWHLLRAAPTPGDTPAKGGSKASSRRGWNLVRNFVKTKTRDDADLAKRMAYSGEGTFTREAGGTYSPGNPLASGLGKSPKNYYH